MCGQEQTRLKTQSVFQSVLVTVLQQLLPFVRTESAGNQVEDCANVTQMPTVVYTVVTVKNGQSQGSVNTRSPISSKLLQKAQNKKTQSYKVEPVSRGANVDIQNFSQENKRETEYVSHTQRCLTGTVILEGKRQTGEGVNICSVVSAGLCTVHRRYRLIHTYNKLPSGFMAFSMETFPKCAPVVTSCPGNSDKPPFFFLSFSVCVWFGWIRGAV